MFKTKLHQLKPDSLSQCARVPQSINRADRGVLCSYADGLAYYEDFEDMAIAHSEDPASIMALYGPGADDPVKLHEVIENPWFLEEHCADCVRDWFGGLKGLAEALNGMDFDEVEMLIHHLPALGGNAPRDRSARMGLHGGIYCWDRDNLLVANLSGSARFGLLPRAEVP